MRILLCNYRWFSDRTAIEVPASLVDDNSPVTKPLGMYDELGEHLIGLLAGRDGLLLWWNNAWCPITSPFPISHVVDGQLRRLSMRMPQITIDIDYEVSPPVATPFYSEGEEDTDFGLWLRNTFESPERQRTIFELWRQGISS